MKMPKISIARWLTPKQSFKRVRADADLFREMYSIEELVGSFVQQTGHGCGFNPDIVKCEISAFDAGTAFDNKTSFVVSMVLDDFRFMYKIRFYIDMGLVVDVRPLDGTGKMMYKYVVYKVCN